MSEIKRITSFHDLYVYQESYEASIVVMKLIIPCLPPSEKYDLADQMSRSCKAVPRLIAEGYAKRHQRLGFKKYIDDSMAESNEMIVCLSHCEDLYGALFENGLCEKMIKSYDKIGRQLYRLSEAWARFAKERP